MSLVLGVSHHDDGHVIMTWGTRGGHTSNTWMMTVLVKIYFKSLRLDLITTFCCYLFIIVVVFFVKIIVQKLVEYSVRLIAS